MKYLKINGEHFYNMVINASNRLDEQKDFVNALNVFPVPDGDTGTNMSMTFKAAVKEIENFDSTSIGEMSKKLAKGALMGARGNSGVILSQLFRGFTKSISEYDKISVSLITLAMEKAVETAYKAVMKPKEGTILTVARGMKDKAVELNDNGVTDFEVFLEEVIKHGEYILSITPDMLPVLKQAGVVDSGGQGLMEVVKGAYDSFLGKEIDYTIVTDFKPVASTMVSNLESKGEEEIKFGYCTEFIILTNKTFNIKHELDFKEFLESIGDSIVVVADEDVVKVHVHTNDPGLAIQNALKYGALSNLKIDNMRLEHQEKVIKMAEKQAVETVEKVVEERKPFGFIAVSVGKGINEIFKGLGVDYIIEGGQTMNPSTEDMLNAIHEVNADTIFILPNNSNIILAANQAKYLVEDKEIIVIPTKTVPQGITAVINFIPDLSGEDNRIAIEREIANVKTGQVTYAVRDTVIDDKTINQGDFMGIGDKSILSVGTDIEEITLDMANQIIDDDDELISIYYGADVTEEDAEKIKTQLEEIYPACDIELQYGGQPIYYYILSAE
jgi:DAK2 domain fusion protein YloV